MCDLERLAMLYGIYRGCTQVRIHKEWGMSVSAVRDFKRGIYDDFLSVFRLHVIDRVGNGVFQCRLCGQPRSKLSAVQRHLLSHFFAPEIAENIDLNDMPRFL